MAGGNQHASEAGARELRRAAAARVVAELRERQAAGEPTSSHVREAAEQLGCSQRTLWRWLAAGEPPSPPVARPAVVIDDRLREAYLEHRGNVAAVWRAERDAGCEPLPSLRALQRAFARELSEAERAFAKHGETGRRGRSLYLRYEAPHRNAVWQADHKQLPVLVVAPRARRAQRPWMTVFLDDYSRALMGWSISLRPTAGDVLAALRDAVVVGAAGGPFGGVPDRLRWDNGLEFAAAAVNQAAAALAIDVNPTRPYAPHEKGKVERLNRTVSQTFLQSLPFYTDGPRRADGTLFAPAAEPMTLQRFCREFAAWVSGYNARPHSGIAGITPEQRWLADPTPIRAIGVSDARALLVDRRCARVRRDGIQHAGHHYVAAELAELVGSTVQIAYPPHDERTVDVYHRGEFVCTAYPQEVLTDAQRERILAERRAHAAAIGRRQRRVSRKARSRLAPVTATNPIAIDTTILDDGALHDRDRQQARRQSLDEQARTDLILPESGPRKPSR